MTMPEEVRGIIEEALMVSRISLSRSGVGAERGDAARAQIDAALDWLDAQAEATEHWEPVGVGEKLDVAGIVGRRILYRMDADTLAILTVEHNTVHAAEMLQLPDGVRLCRKAEVTA